ncbi:MAG: HAD hydrolase family protein [Corynebacteriales bacterium]|nr:HAD hydrolase family protein [Mycobacteriales bacterium]
MDAVESGPASGKLLLVDLDKSALRDDGTFGPATIAFFQEAHEAGNELVVVTARYVSSTIKLLNQHQGCVSAIFGMHGAQVAFWERDSRRYVDRYAREVARMHYTSERRIDEQAMGAQADRWAVEHGDPRVFLSRAAMRDVREVSLRALNGHIAEHNSRQPSNPLTPLEDVYFAVRAGAGNRLHQEGFQWRDPKNAGNRDEGTVTWQEMLDTCTASGWEPPIKPALKMMLDPGSEITAAQTADVINGYMRARGRRTEWQIRSSGAHCEIFHRDLGKELCVSEAQLEFGIDRQDSYYLGDAGADVEPMKLCGHALMPSNHTITLAQRREIEEAGAVIHLCGSNDAEGPAKRFRGLLNMPGPSAPQFFPTGRFHISQSSDRRSGSPRRKP